MTPERWQQVKEIFNAALQREPDDRSVFLVSACGADNALRREVESLITAHEKDGSFIDAPAYDAATESLIADQELRAGQLIGHYEILSTLGRGGMGEVYLARDTKLGRKVALKFLPIDFTRNADRLRRFEQEARAASALNHPSIITIYEIGDVDGHHFIATEFIDGQTLRQHMLGKPLRIAEALNIAEQVVSALSEAHDAGILHRDIKPDNIMLRRDGLVKLVDFGLAKLSDRKPIDPEDATRAMVQTNAGAIMGTVAYMSPEQARGLTVDARTDLWSLGVVLYEMISGRTPFAGPTTSDIIASVLEREPAALGGVSANVPETLEWIVTKALNKERNGRYQTATELLTDLRRLKQKADLAAEHQPAFEAAPLEPDTNQKLPPSRKTTTASAGVTGRANAGLPSVFRPALWPKRTWLIIAMVLLGVVGAAAVIGIAPALKNLTSRTTELSRTATVSKTAQVTFSTGLDHYPSLSPDGNAVAYSSDQNGSFEIYVKQLTPGGRDIQLTADGHQSLQPAWSPDGQRIAYFSLNRGGIWIVPAFGGTPKQLVDFGSRPAWSRDGLTIAFQSGAGRDVGESVALAPSTIWTIPSSGGSPSQITQIAQPPGGHSTAAWSPDGKYIAFSSSDYSSSSCWQISVDTKELRQIAPSGGDPVYSPKGDEIYLTRVKGDPGLARIRLATGTRNPGEPEVVVSAGPGSSMNNPSISVDGKKVVYTVARHSSTLWAISLNGNSVGAPTSFARDTSQRSTTPRFSPDGQRIALSKNRAGSGTDIWLADADGKNLSQLTTNPAADFSPSWFPDNDRIAFLSGREANTRTLWSLSVKTGKEERLLDLGPTAAFAVLSPDGKRVAFNSAKSGTINMWVAPLDGGEPKQLTFSKGDRMGFPSWSRDGQFIAFLASRGEDGYLMVMPSAGGPATQLTSEDASFVYSWSPDGDKIIYAGERDGLWNLYWISPSTREQKQLTHFTKLNAFARYPELSPLGNQIVYEYAETTGNIWLAELK